MSTRIYRACDSCEALGIDAAGTTRGPFLGRTIDLCDACYDTYVKELAALLDDRGVPVDGAKRKYTRRAVKAPVTAEQSVPVSTDPDGVPCPLCGDVASSKDTFTSHLGRVHGTRPGVLFGSVCPVCGQDDVASIGAHASRAHGALGIRRAVDAFEWARVNGDPHGVYAARIAPHIAA